MAAAAAASAGALMAASGPAASGTMMFISPENQIVRRTVERFAEEPEKRGLLDMTVHDFDGEDADAHSCSAKDQGAGHNRTRAHILNNAALADFRAPSASPRLRPSATARPDCASGALATAF